ncbi:RNA 2',3'-cyclic phosphodiesterase, partial [Klebsiella pneumoniae]|uniref:RNA 2',3'-cyclic phosphodiesterase n=1 Tax=Klebsiella pneumoniae TaxID=573 RepID=UPI0027300046
MDLSRAFVAIELDTATAGRIAKWIRTLKSQVADVRWSRPEQLHVTLKFLGDVDNRELPQLCAAMREACQGIEA